MGEINMGDLYSFNKNAMLKEKPLDTIMLNSKTIQIAKWLKSLSDSGEAYTMLLCRERYDFTLFNIISSYDYKPMYENLLVALSNRGSILAIDKTADDKAYEIWIRDDYENDVFVYYLFPYTKGVIEINE